MSTVSKLQFLYYFLELKLELPVTGTMSRLELRLEWVSVKRLWKLRHDKGGRSLIKISIRVIQIRTRVGDHHCHIRYSLIVNPHPHVSEELLNFQSLMTSWSWDLHIHWRWFWNNLYSHGVFDISSVTLFIYWRAFSDLNCYSCCGTNSHGAWWEK